jgi:hypothetical protein
MGSVPSVYSLAHGRLRLHLLETIVIDRPRVTYSQW